MGKLTIVGIDQSYSRVGYSVVTRTGVKEISSIDLSKMRNPTQKRNCIREMVRILIRNHRPKAIVVERVRTFAGGKISSRTSGMLAAMTAAIVDAAYTHDFKSKPTPVFSVDTRAWKKAMLGNSSASKDDAVQFARALCQTLGINVEIDHDAADAFCIARYVWTQSPKLQRER